MDLSLYTRMLRRRWRLFALVVVACVGGAAVAAWLQTPQYTTTAVLVVTSPAPSPTATGASGQQTAAASASTLSQFATTAPVEAAAAATAASTINIAAHQPNQITATADGNTPFLDITVTDTDPRWARAVANAYVEAMPSALQHIDPVVASSAGQVTVLTDASLPSSPSNPNKTLYLTMGLVLGLVLAVGLVTLWEAIDQRVHDPEEASRRLGVRVLGTIPQQDPDTALPARDAGGSARAEAYRAVHANLAFGESGGLPRALVVTGPSVGSGATTVAANVALALAGGGRRVVLVDANLRDPQLQDLFGLENGPGLAEALGQGQSPRDALRPVPGATLWVLPAGRAPHNPADLITREQLAGVIKDLQEHADVVVIDAPPVLPVADALFLAAAAGSALLVARADSTGRGQLRDATDALRQLHVQLLGIVVNGVRERRESLPSRRRHASPAATNRGDAARADGRPEGAPQPAPVAGSD